MTMAVSDIETQDLLKSIDAKLGSIVTIMAKNANVAENGKCAKIAQDPYTEQRKWIGKLCRFWGDGCASNYISLLKQIDDDETPFADDKGVYWEHCEPVKPDDDIIYKGERDENI